MYNVSYAPNGVHLGEFIIDVDGYYKFWPRLSGGYWEGYVLRAIADKEEELNKEWDDHIKNDPIFKEIE
jgi:hypothetical protein